MILNKKSWLEEGSLHQKIAMIDKKKMNVSRADIPVNHKNLFFLFNGIFLCSNFYDV